ncbi:hypothetical protein ACEPAF_5843 [Sanghuangporus sanghuang]
MFQDDVDADYGVVRDDEIDVDYPYPWDNDPEPKTPLRRPNPHDPIEPRRRRDRIRGRVPLTRNYDGSLTLPGDIKDGSSQETQDDHPLRIPQRELLSDPLHSDGLSGYSRLSQSELPLRNATTTPRHNRRAPLAKETPLALRETTNKHAMHPNKAEDKHLRNADDGIRVLIGPMPVEEFLDEFLPAVDESEMPDPTGAFDTVPAKANHETHIYPPLIAAINENGRCPGLTFVDTSVTSEQSGRGVSKPDVTAYNEGDVSLLKQVRSKTSNAIHTCANLGIAETFFEVKPDDQNPLKDDHEENESFFDWENYMTDSRKREKKKRAFGQNVSYASEGCARQHRVFYHSVLIVGTRARFFRWDRAGTIVTRAFDYQQNPELLCRYLWRFSGADMVERGFDPTVTIASQQEIELFEDAVTEEVIFQKNIDSNDTAKLHEAVEVHFEKNKVTKVMVHKGSQSTPEEYLVSVPVHCPLSSSGRSSRCYWSTKIVKKGDGNIEKVEIGFLKDIWRIDLPGLTSEGEILSDMGQKKVPNIPELDCFGDVPDEDTDFLDSEGDSGDSAHDLGEGEPVIGTSEEPQTTRTQEFIHEEWVSASCHVLPEQSTDDLYRRIVRHVHFRMTTTTVGYPLSEFTDAVELFLALQDVLEALIVAYEKCKRLHRDVSLDNIILFLVDREGKAGDYYRSGTWAYMSTNALLRKSGFRHSHQDDLESLFYVSLYCAILWLPHNIKKRLGTWMFNFFDYSSLDDEQPSGGDKKRTYKYNPSKFTTEFLFKNGHIKAWFSNTYADLATYAEENVKGRLALTAWTSEDVWRHMRAVCNGLSKGKQTGVERVAHSVADKFIPGVSYYWATRVSTSIITGSRVSEISQPQSERGSKRSMTEIEGPYQEPQPENKRSRLSIRSGNSDHSPLRLDSDGGSDNDVGEQQEQHQESQDQESPDELLLGPLARGGQHVPRCTLQEDFLNKPGTADDDYGDLYG